MRILRNSLVVLFFLFSASILSQTTESTGQKKLYRYTFNGELLPELKTELEGKILKLEFVSEAKIKYKPDSQKGEIILKVSDYIKSSEGDNRGFSVVELKKLILSYNITPLEFTNVEN